MIHTVKNEVLTLEVSSQGAELHALRSTGGPEGGWLWDGDPAVWGRRAPVCFPWCGRLKDGRFEEEGASFQGPVHGLIRDLEHELTAAGPDSLTFLAQVDAEPGGWPWPFRFETVHRLEGTTVMTTCTATNTGGRPMPVQLGFHTALRCPFTAGKRPGEYQIRFQREERPFEVCCDENGLVTGGEHAIWTGQPVIPVTEELFDHDSICLRGLCSDWVQLEERATGRALRLEIGDYPYVLLWSMPGVPGFLCIEPWSGLPSRRDGGHTLWERAGTVPLAPGETFCRVQRLTVLDPGTDLTGTL